MTGQIIAAENCGNCKFRQAVIGGGLECRRDPPTAMLIPGPGGRPVPVAFWPPVESEQRCGQHVRGLLSAQNA